MRIPEFIRKTVAHLYVDDAKRKGQRRPVGTAFGVAVELEHAPSNFVAYLVTARHIVYGARASGRLHVRFNKPDGTTLDVPTEPDDWLCHAMTDVAIISMSEAIGDIDFMPITVQQFFVTEEYLTENNVGEGDDVFLVGLFQGFLGRSKNEPILRFGKIALARRELIKIKTDPGQNAPHVAVEAYLVETRSWGGSSGAPVFAYFEPTRRIVNKVEALTPLLGLVHGHYDIDAQVRFDGSEDAAGVVGVNSGIAIVIPASAVMELLMADEVVRHRNTAKPRDGFQPS